MFLGLVLTHWWAELCPGYKPLQVPGMVSALLCTGWFLMWLSAGFRVSQSLYWSTGGWWVWIPGLLAEGPKVSLSWVLACWLVGLGPRGSWGWCQPAGGLAVS